jgi:hypothetical protein
VFQGVSWVPAEKHEHVEYSSASRVRKVNQLAHGTLCLSVSVQLLFNLL